MSKPLFVPRNERVSAKDTGILTRLWQTLMDNLVANVQAAAGVEGSESLTAQSATIAATAIGAPVAGGLYRVSYQIVVTQAATTSSSATLTIAWVSNGLSFSHAFAAMNGNTTTTQQTGSLPLINVDEDTEITYAVLYSSVGATAMEFATYFAVELIPD